MKLSKQERIGVLIIAVVLIIGLGIFFFIVPKVKDVKSSSLTLNNKQTEYQAAVDKAATKDSLKTQIIDAYNSGRDQADMFFTEMTTYELDNEVRAFLQYCKDNDLNILVEQMTVSPATVEPLSVSFFDEAPGAQYDLKIFATQGVTATEEEIAAATRRATLMSQLSTPQNVAASKAAFTFSALSPDDYIKFVDIVNNYEKNENGKTIRKALAVNGMNIVYDEVETEYAKLVAELEEEALGDSNDVLEEYADKMGFEAKINEKATQAGNTDAAGDANAPAAGGDEDDEDDEKKGIVDCLKSYSVTLTFYCVERMQDPTDILDAQDAA